MKKETKAIIFGAGAVLGVLVTSVLSARAAVKANDELEHKAFEKGEQLTAKEKIKASARYYVVPVISGVATVGMIYLSNKEHKALETALLSTITYGADQYQKNRDIFDNTTKMPDDFKEKHNIDENIPNVKDIYVANADNRIIDTGVGDEIFYDFTTGFFIKTSYENVLNAAYHFNRNYALGKEMTCYEWAEWLGVPKSLIPETLRLDGWNYSWVAEENEMFWLDIYTEKNKSMDGLEYTSIYFELPPVEIDWEPSEM